MEVKKLYRNKRKLLLSGQNMTEDELRTIVRTNIRQYRNFRQWTQAEFAEKLDISVNFLCDIENGKRWISPASMVKIAKVLNIEPFELFKPANVPLPTVSTLFLKYNDEVVEAVSTSLKQVYRYFQAQIVEEATPPEKSETC
jgi:transcriptional regulator with XRE-family HTH domain